MEESIFELENMRRRASSYLIKIIIFSSAVGIINLLFYASLDKVQLGVYLSAGLVLGVGFLLGKVTGYFNLFNEYKLLFKKTFVEAPLQDRFSNVFYDSKRGFEKEVIGNSGIMCLGNQYKSNDYLKGCYKEVNFQRADVIIQQLQRMGKTTYTVTYLHGRWLIFEFNKRFQFDLQIIGKGFPMAYKKSTIFAEAEERRHRIELEDMEFNEMFEIYCQDDHEAYYILTPHFMSMLKNMYRSMDGAIMLGFIHNELHVAIHNNRDAMEPKLFQEIDFNLVKEEVDKEIDVIINIIDGLNLDIDLYNTKGANG